MALANDGDLRGNLGGRRRVGIGRGRHDLDADPNLKPTALNFKPLDPMTGGKF